MEGRKQVGSSPKSSFTSDLFGSKESTGSSSSGIFGSIFAPSSKVVGRESVCYEVGDKRQDYASQVWNSKPGAQGVWRNTKFCGNIVGTTPWSSGGKNQSFPSRDIGSFYQEDKVQPCHLSSSIYYGGQEIYSHPQNTQNSGYTTLNKDGGEDDSGSASRGNWWQGSLYY